MKQPIKRPKVGKCYRVTHGDGDSSYVMYDNIEWEPYYEAWYGDGTTVYSDGTIRFGKNGAWIGGFGVRTKFREVSPATWNEAVRKCIDAAIKQLIDVTPKKKRGGK